MASLLAALMAANSGLVSDVSSGLRRYLTKLGAASVIITATSAIVTISSISVKPWSRPLPVWRFIMRASTGGGPTPYSFSRRYWSSSDLRLPDLLVSARLSLSHKWLSLQLQNRQLH